MPGAVPPASLTLPAHNSRPPAAPHAKKPAVNRESIPALEPELRGAPPAGAFAFNAAWAWLSLLLPLCFGIWALSGEPSWGDDAAIVRDLGFVPTGAEGNVSTLATQLLALLPLGGQMLRTSLVGVLALGLSSRLLFGALRALLERRAGTPLNPALACFASSIWALSPAVQHEALRAGGALPALALVLSTQRLATAAFAAGDSGLLAATGIAWGAAIAESHVAGACIGVWLFVLAWGAGRRRMARELWRLLVTCSGVLMLAASLRWLRPQVLPPLASLSLAVEAPARTTWLELGRAVIGGWTQELGVVTLVLAGAGVLIVVFSRSLRRHASAWFLCLVLAVPSVAWPAAGTPSVLLALLASLGVAAFFPIAVQALVLVLWASRLPFARPAAVLSMTFATTLVLSRAERNGMGNVGGALPLVSGAELWTEAALGQLPPDSLVLVRSPALVLRLLASRTLHGTRPDVLIVSSALLSSSALRGEGALSEPSLLPLLRQLWVNGSADEYSLCRLADVRPVFTELDASYDSHLLEHLTPEGIWLGVSAHALAPSERRAGTERSLALFRDTLRRAGGADALDPATRRVLGEAAAQQGRLLGLLGERQPAERLLRAARRIERRGPLGSDLQALGGPPARVRVAAGDRLR
jgi:hypothetical protein